MSSPENRGMGFDHRDVTKLPPVDAHELLRKSIVEHPPKFEDLPLAVRIDSRLLFMEEADEDIEEFGEEIDLSQLGAELRDMHDEYDTEFSCAVVVDHNGKLELGPIMQGEKHSAPIAAPLKRTELTTPSGLVVFRDQVIGAVIHTHNREYSFSLQDVYQHFNRGKESIKQMYVVRSSGEIDMAHITSDSVLMSEEVFARLSSLWKTYLDTDGMFRSECDEEEYNNFIKRILNETLKIGFYTNRDSDDPAVLHKFETKKR